MYSEIWLVEEEKVELGCSMIKWSGTKGQSICGEDWEGGQSHVIDVCCLKILFYFFRIMEQAIGDIQENLASCYKQGINMGKELKIYKDFIKKLGTKLEEEKEEKRMFDD